MIAVFKKEFRSYFTSVLGWIFLAFLIFIVSLYFVSYNLLNAQPQFEYALQGVVFVLLIVVPILTMRTMADEKRLKTDQMLLCAPVKVIDIVLGKYLALLSVFTIGVAITCLYPVFLTQLGTINVMSAYNAIFGFFLFGAALLGIGLYISSLTENQIVAAVISFAVLLLGYFASGITSIVSTSSLASLISLLVLSLICIAIVWFMTNNLIVSIATGCVIAIASLVLYLMNASLFSGLLGTVFGAINITEKFGNFISGIFDVTGIVYYASIVGLCLFLTIQSVQKRRWS